MHMQEKVGIRSHHCSVIATDIKQKVDEEVADAEGPSTSRKSGRVTLCVEGNISAGKSTFLNWVAQGHPELDGMLEVLINKIGCHTPTCSLNSTAAALLKCKAV